MTGSQLLFSLLIHFYNYIHSSLLNHGTLTTFSEHPGSRKHQVKCIAAAIQLSWTIKTFRAKWYALVLNTTPSCRVWGTNRWTPPRLLGKSALTCSLKLPQLSGLTSEHAVRVDKASFMSRKLHSLQTASCLVGIHHLRFQGDPGHGLNAIRAAQLKEVSSSRTAESGIFILIKPKLIKE